MQRLHCAPLRHCAQHTTDARERAGKENKTGPLLAASRSARTATEGTRAPTAGSAKRSSSALLRWRTHALRFLMTVGKP